MTTTDGARVAHIAFAVLGTVLLVVGSGVTFVFGVLATFLDDACTASDLRPGGAIDCRNAEPAKLLLLITPLVAAPGAALLTWFPSTRHGTYRPRGWAPFIGIGLVAVAWLVAVELFPVI